MQGWEVKKENWKLYDKHESVGLKWSVHQRFLKESQKWALRLLTPTKIKIQYMKSGTFLEQPIQKDDLPVEGRG